MPQKGKKVFFKGPDSSIIKREMTVHRVSLRIQLLEEENEFCKLILVGISRKKNNTETINRGYNQTKSVC
jgi:hypothetical protein